MCVCMWGGGNEGIRGHLGYRTMCNIVYIIT